MVENDPGPLRPPEKSAGDFGYAPAAMPDDDAADEGGLTGLTDEITTLFDDARTYAEAEIAFQKTRAGLVGKTAGRAVVLLVLALVLLHIALIALAVGAVIALAPYVTIWGAIAIVVGVLLAGSIALVLAARGDGTRLGAMFAAPDEAP